MSRWRLLGGRLLGFTVLGLIVWWLCSAGIPVLWGPSASKETYQAGQELFVRDWLPDDPLTQGDGLGPVYNASSCVECHFQGGIGGGGDKRTPALAGIWADEYNSFLSPPDVVGPRIRVMREVAGERSVEATVMGHALVGATDSEYRDRLAKTALRLETTPEELEERWTNAGLILGTPAQAAESVAALEEAGVERIYVQWLDLADYDGLASTLDIVRG